jgi:hypothetical protein
MKITQFEMGLNKTINLGNYESLKVQVGATISTTTETVDADKAELHTYLQKALDEIIYASTKPNRGVKQRPAIRDDY